MLNATEAARAITAAHERGCEVVTVTVTGGPAAGLRYWSAAPGALSGALDGSLDEQARALATQVWRTRGCAFADPLFAECHTLPEPLLIFGAGHIAVALAGLAHDLGFRVTVLDDRADFARPARFPGGVTARTLDLSAPLQDLEISARTFVILLTRAHAHDFDCLRALLRLPVQPRYIGMIGSKRRVRAAFTALLAEGIAPVQLAAVHAPLGVEIGAETPAEIAVSIAAELIQVRRNAPAGGKSRDARVLERMLPENAAQ